MELEEALNQVEKLEEQVQVAVKAGGDEVLHTVMEIRQNPYEDLDDGEGGLGGFKDHTVEIAASPFEDNLVGGDLSKKRNNMFSIPPLKGMGLSASNDKMTIANQGNLKMNLGLHNLKNVGNGNARAKKNMVKMGIPALDLSTLKNAKEYKDWYGLCQKLENAIRLLREKTEALENERDMKDLHIMKQEKQIETLEGQVKNYAAQNKQLNDKY